MKVWTGVNPSTHSEEVLAAIAGARRSSTQTHELQQTQKGPDLSRGVRALLLACVTALQRDYFFAAVFFAAFLTVFFAAAFFAGAFFAAAFFAGAFFDCLLHCLLCCFLSCQGSTSRIDFLLLECSCCQTPFSKQSYRRAEHSTSSSRQISMSSSSQPSWPPSSALF